MRNCKNCAFCKKDAISNYINEADFYQCDMDGDLILDPSKEGEDCAWFREKPKSKDNIIKKMQRWIKCRKWCEHNERTDRT